MKILMVCLGNICRSPLAEGILHDIAKQRNLNWTVDSAGTAGYHVGEAPDPRSIQIAKDKGLDISNQSCRKFHEKDFEEFDKILVMDRSNLHDVLSLARSENDRSKVELILKYHPEKTVEEVPDPYYGGEDGFGYVFNLLYYACIEIANQYENPNR